MTYQFLSSYITSLSLLSKELGQNQRSIVRLNDSTKVSTLDIQQKFQEMFVDTIKLQTHPFDDDDEEAAALVRRDSKLRLIYLLVRQIQRNEAEKQFLTREGCKIVDKFFASVNQSVENAAADYTSTGDHGGLLLKTVDFVKDQLNQPVAGNAVIVELIKKLEKEQAEKNGKTSDVNENHEEMDKPGTSQSFMLREMAREMETLTTERIDNLQAFSEKVLNICTDIRRRCRVKRVPNAGNSNDNVVEEEEQEEEASSADKKLCHCRGPEFGPMVFCDNSLCKIRWYHFECVGLCKTPEGSWFCPNCSIFENV